MLNSSGGIVAQNDDWRTQKEQPIRQTGLAPSNDREAAVLLSTADLQGNRQLTVQVRGVNGGAGIGTVEIYALGASSHSSSELLNISTRGRVGTGDEVLIGGVIAQGSAAQRV
ncbi:MAG TPA: hypothetical protein VK993_06545, partial [Chthoniobacterales bacterium]|nr:hypothetical protein [Chthoniobacterales bacterium]